MIAFLDTFSAKDFEGADDCSVTTPRWEGKSMTGDQLPHRARPARTSSFTSPMSYALLRNAGVDVGKRDFLGKLTFR